MKYIYRIAIAAILVTAITLLLSSYFPDLLKYAPWSTVFVVLGNKDVLLWLKDFAMDLLLGDYKKTKQRLSELKKEHEADKLDLIDLIGKTHQEMKEALNEVNEIENLAIRLEERVIAIESSIKRTERYELQQEIKRIKDGLDLLQEEMLDMYSGQGDIMKWLERLEHPINEKRNPESRE